MGSESHNFLADSILFDDRSLENGFRAISEERLRAELDAYRAHCLLHADDLLREVYACESATKIFAGVRNPVTFDLLKQTAFYVDQFVLDDPLFAAAHPGTAEGKVLNEFYGMKPNDWLGNSVAGAARFMKRLTPFIAANYVKVLPVSSIFEAKGGVPLTASENRFEDGLPSDIMRFYRERVVVKRLRRDDHSLIEVDDPSPCRHIAVRFREDDADYVRLYSLFENKVLSFDEATSTATFSMTMPADPPDQAYFDAWMDQAINQTAIAVDRELTTEFRLARSLKAAYFMKSSFAFSALQYTLDDVKVQRPMSTLASIDLPFIADVDPEVLIRMRNEESDAFERFRRHIDKHLRTIASTDDSKRPAKIDDVAAELQYEAAEVGAVVLRAQKKLAAHGTVAAAALTAGVLSSGWTVPLAVTAAASAYSAYQDYRAKVEAPAYFLWRVLSA